jgi:hypothetical protein
MAKDLFPDRTALAALCRQHHIRRLSLFGSVLKETARQDSDVDSLVEFEPGQKPGLLSLAAFVNGRQRTDLDMNRMLLFALVRASGIIGGPPRKCRRRCAPPLTAYRGLRSSPCAIG